MWINIEQSDGTKYGDGPITTATSWRSWPRMDRPGKFSFRCPVGERQAAEIVAKRHVHCFDIVNGSVTQLGVGGIIDKIETVIAGGMPHLLVSGDDLLRDLRRHTVGYLELYEVAGSYANPNELWIFEGYDRSDIEMSFPHEYQLDGGGNNPDYIYGGHETRTYGLDIDVGANVNGQTATMKVQYLSSVTGEWAEFDSGLTDGTAAGGCTLAQDGQMTWSITDAEREAWEMMAHAGVVKYWYRLTPSAGLDTVTFNDIDAKFEIASTTPIADIMAFAPAGWSVEDQDAAADPEPTLLPILKFGGESVLTALQKLAEDTGEHFRLGSGKTLVWIQSTVASGIRAIGVHGADSVSLDGNALVCLIKSLTVTEDHYEVATRVYPYGAGRGLGRVTLVNSDGSKAGYTVSTGDNYIKIDTETTGTREDRVLNFPEIGTEYDDAVSSVKASNDLLDAAHEWLSRHITAQTAYRVGVLKLDAAVEPGETIDVFYQEFRDGTQVVDVDATLYVLEATHEISTEGTRTVALYLGSVDAWPQSDGSAVAGISHRVSRLEGGSESPTTRTLLQTTTVEAHEMLSASHSDALAAEVVDGDVVIGNVTPKWSRLAIAIPAANVRNVLGVDNAELRPSWKTALDATNPANIANAASPGTSLLFAHRDHVHAHPGGLTDNLHHNPVTAGTLISLSIQEVSLSVGSAQWQVPLTGADPFTPAWTAASADVSAGVEAILKSTAAGDLAVHDLTAAGKVGIGTAAPGTNIGGGTMDRTGGVLEVESAAAWANIIIDGNNPGASLIFADSGAAENDKISEFIAAAGKLTFRSLTDAGGARVDPIWVADLGTGYIGFGIAAPSAALHVLKTAEQLRLGYDAAKYLSIEVEGTDDVNISATGNLIKFQSSVTLQAENYASQTTGWRVTYGGSADFRYLFVDEMHAKAFICDLEQALAGGQIISKSVAVLAADFSIPTAGNTGNFVVEAFDGFTTFKVFVDGDIVRFRQFSRADSTLTIADGWGTVLWQSTDETAKTQTYQLTRSAGALAGTASGTIPQGTLVLDYGTTGNGFIESTCIDGAMAANAPYTQIVTWTTHPQPSANRVVRIRQGNLNGIFGTPNEYGLFAGEGHDEGSGDQYMRLSTAGFDIFNLQVKVYDGADLRIHLEPTTPYLAVGAATDYAVGDGIWMGLSTTYKFRVGDADGERVEWDGSAIYIRADADNYFRATGTAISMYGGGAKWVELTNAAVLTLGNVVGGEYTQIDSTGIEMYGSGDKHVDLTSAGVLNLYANALTYTQYTGDTVQFHAAGALRMLFGDPNGHYGYTATATGLVIGRDFDNQTIVSIETTNGFRIRHRTAGPTYTTIGQWATNGDVTFGQVAAGETNLFWDNSAGKLLLRMNTVTILDFNATATAIFHPQGDEGVACSALEGNSPRFDLFEVAALKYSLQWIHDDKVRLWSGVNGVVTWWVDDAGDFANYLQAANIRGTIHDLACEAFTDDAIAIFTDIQSTLHPTFLGPSGRRKHDMAVLATRYPFLYSAGPDSYPEEVRYSERLGPKTDLLIRAVLQLNERDAELETRLVLLEAEA